MVASLATMTHSRPETRPTPQIIDAACTSPPYMPQAASWPISRNGEPGSSSLLTRSLGSILPQDVLRLGNVHVADEIRLVQRVRQLDGLALVLSLEPVEQASRGERRNGKGRGRAVGDAVKARRAREVFQGVVALQRDRHHDRH